MELFNRFVHEAGVRNFFLLGAEESYPPVALVLSSQPEEQFIPETRSTGDIMESAFFTSMRLLLGHPRYSKILGNARACWLFTISVEDNVSPEGIITLPYIPAEPWNRLFNGRARQVLYTIANGHL
ncbi:hypothetical protein IWQ61_005232 [Dispira simplex]|nr:hypothetical protein IWQ61_005232 [Dispira simplex]